MMTTISDGATTVTPRLVVGFSSHRTGRNVIRDLVGTEEPAVDLRTAQKRSGSLVLLFETLETALAAEVMHAGPSKLTLTEEDWPNGGMTYVTAGDVDLELDDDTQAVWILTVEYREVSP